MAMADKAEVYSLEPLAAERDHKGHNSGKTPNIDRRAKIRKTADGSNTAKRRKVEEASYWE
jgi:hypothetical protein